MKRIELDDRYAFYNLGCVYDQGKFGFPQNYAKALELWHRAGELGHPSALCNVGNAYFQGRGVQRDSKKGMHYWEKAAMLGHIGARYNLGVLERHEGSKDRALKHFLISAGCGFVDSLKEIKELFTDGYATKDDYGTALRAHQSYLDEIRSNQRDEAAAYDEGYKYY